MVFQPSDQKPGHFDAVKWRSSKKTWPTKDQTGASALGALLAGTLLATLIVSAVGTFNHHVDPMCYYNCPTIDLDHRTLNFYYQVGQKIVAHPETEAIILGSSRGQTTPPIWVQKVTGLKTLNLSIGGAELTAKIAFLNIALEKTQLKKVIWWADYFELIPEVADTKIKNTPALRHYLADDMSSPGLMMGLGRILELIDHNTLEASFYALKNRSEYRLDQGSGTDIDFKKCEGGHYTGERTAAELAKENGLAYDTYSRKIFRTPQSPAEWNLFVNKLKQLSERGIDVDVIATPYYPQFAARLKREMPETYKNHGVWIEELKSLSLPHVHVVNYFEGLDEGHGIPGGDESPRYWNDGVHFTCRGAMAMLAPLLTAAPASR